MIVPKSQLQIQLGEEDDNLNEKAKEARRAYNRAYYHSHKEARRQTNERYWNRKAEKIATEEAKHHDKAD